MNTATAILRRLLLAIGMSLFVSPLLAAELALDLVYSHSGFDSPEEALADFHKGRFQPLPAALSRIGWAESPVWLVAKPAAKWAGIESPYIEVQPLPVASLDVWAVDEASGGLRHLGRSGVSVPYRLSAEPQARLATVPLRDMQGSQPLILRVEPVGMTVVHPAIISGSTHATHAYLAGLAGGALIFFLATHLAVSVSIYRLVRMPEGLYWTGLMAAGGLLLAMLNGVVPIRLADASPNTLGWLLGINATLVIVLLSQLILPILQVRQFLPRLHYWLKISIWAFWPALVGGYWLTGSALAGALTWHFVQISLMILVGCLRWPTLIAEVRPLLIAGLFLVLAMEWLYAGLLKLVPLSWTSHITWQVMLIGTMVISLVELLKGNFSERRYVRAERERLHGLLIQEKQQLALRVEERTLELRSALSEVQRFEAHQRELLSLASHEFRTPAAIIKSSLEVVDCLPQSISPEAAPFMESVRVASGRLVFLANKLLDHDRWREMSIKPKMSPLELVTWIQEIVDDVPSDQNVVTQLCAAPVHVDADTVLLRIALQNLIDNALAHNAFGAGVTVSLEVEQAMAHLIVDDNGKGVPDSSKHQVFERFFSERSGPSHGLGLSIVRAIARLHGGDARVGDAPSGGARFAITLPCLPK